MADWISVREASKMSGYNDDHLRELIRYGKINADKVVTVWLVEKKSLLAYMKAMRTRGKKRGPKKS